MPIPPELLEKYPHTPGKLLSQNSELRPLGIWNWTIPAWRVTLSDGTDFNACPHAGRCTKVCYAMFGKYIFKNVRARHLANLEYVLNHTDEWQAQMLAEVGHKRFNPTGEPHDLWHDETDRWLHEWVQTGGRSVRVHDAGDFFAPWYLERWMEIADTIPHVLFYAYTKEVEMVQATEDALPTNFRILYSFGGLQDHLIDRDKHRNCDVFPSERALEAAGYFNQEENDVLAVTAPTTRIGVVSNDISTANKAFDGRTMSEMGVRGRMAIPLRVEHQLTIDEAMELNQ